MRLLLTAAALTLMTASPLAAAENAPAPAPAWAPPGKLHAIAMRGAENRPCADSRTDPTGNRPIATRPVCKAAQVRR